LGLGQQEISQIKRHQSTKGMPHQPQRAWQLAKGKALPELLRKARRIKPLQVLPLIQPLAMASKIGSQQDEIVRQQRGQAQQVAAIEHGAVQQEHGGGGWKQHCGLIKQARVVIEDF
jgi:hypothetical protein